MERMLFAIPLTEEQSIMRRLCVQFDALHAKNRLLTQEIVRLRRVITRVQRELDHARQGEFHWPIEELEHDEQVFETH